MLTAALAVAFVLLAVLVAVGYNQLVRSRNQVREAWSGIDVQLRRRGSLIPNLIEIVRGYAQHERDTFEQVGRARSALQTAGGAREAAGANEALTVALGRLFAVVESYPQLRASDNFRRLQADLSDTEDKIAYARQFYNRNVLDYNNRVDVFPTVVLARAFDFTPSEFFEADDAGRGEVHARFRSQPVTPEQPASPPAA